MGLMGKRLLKQKGKITVEIDMDTLDEIERLCEEFKQTMDETVEEALIRYIEVYEGER